MLVMRRLPAWGQAGGTAAPLSVFQAQEARLAPAMHPHTGQLPCSAFNPAPLARPATQMTLLFHRPTAA